MWQCLATALGVPGSGAEMTPDAMSFIAHLRRPAPAPCAIDLAGLDDQLRVAQDADVRERIAAHDEQVGVPARLDVPDLRHAEETGRVDRAALEGLLRRKAVLDVQGQLLGHLADAGERRSAVIAGRDRDPHAERVVDRFDERVAERNALVDDELRDPRVRRGLDDSPIREHRRRQGRAAIEHQLQRLDGRAVAVLDGIDAGQRGVADAFVALGMGPDREPRLVGLLAGRGHLLDRELRRAAFWLGVIIPPVDITLMAVTPALICDRTALRTSSGPSTSQPIHQPWPPVIVMTRPQVIIRGPGNVAVLDEPPQGDVDATRGAEVADRRDALVQGLEQALGRTDGCLGRHFGLAAASPGPATHRGRCARAHS